MRPVTVSVSDASGGAKSSQLVRFDEWESGPTTIQCVVTGTVNYTIQLSNDDPNSPTNPVALASMTWSNSQDPAAVGATATLLTQFDNTPLFAKVLLNSGTGSVVTTFVQMLGGGGGTVTVAGSTAVTIADGADVALGAKADTAVTDPTLSATVIALLKGLLTGIRGKSSATGTPTQVASNVAAQTILAANAARLGGSVYYDAAAILYLVCSATTPTSSVFTVKMGAGLVTYFELPANYTGIVRGIWSVATGSADVTEYT